MDTQRPQGIAQGDAGRGMESSHPASSVATAAVHATYQQYMASQAAVAGSATPHMFPAPATHCPPQLAPAISPSLLQATQNAARAQGGDSLILPRRTAASNGTRKRTRTPSAEPAAAVAPPVVSEDERKRVDRNLKEQQRSIQISTLLGTLRDILIEANVHPDSDKLSRHTTLASVVDYIKQLQHANSHFDTENQELRKSITKVNEVLTKGQPGGQETAVATKAKPAKSSPLDVDSEGDVDYQCVFQQCGVALAAVKIDGRFIDCNAEFEALTGHDRDELIAPIQSSSEEAEEPAKAPNTASSSSSRESSVDSSLTGSTTATLTLFSLLDPASMEELYEAMKRVIEDAMGKCDDNYEGSSQAGPRNQATARQCNFWCGKIISRQEPGEVRHQQPHFVYFVEA